MPKKFTFCAKSPILKDIIKNKSIKYIFLDDKIILNKRVLRIFLEDIIHKNINMDYEPIKKLENINEYIQDDISYPNYYEILSGNLYEYLE